MERIINYGGNGNMERLTIKAPSGLIHLKDNKEMTVNAAIKKLSDYEDLEEQGKLLKLPCVVGTQIYVIETHLGGGRIPDWKEISDKYFFHPDMLVDRNFMTGNAIFGKNAFLTGEEAEAALKDLWRSERR